MPTTFKLVEPMSKLAVSAPFSVNESGVHVFECLRLLCGTVDIEKKDDGKTFKLRRCFLTESQRKLSRASIRSIVDVAFDGEFTIKDLEAYLASGRRRNAEFWKGLAAELTMALACRERQAFLECFLHLYRLIEMTSVALPLFYAGSEHNYRRALDFLKSLPQNPRDGDLAIFKKFISEISRLGGYDRHKIKINYSRGDIRWDASFERQVEAYVIAAEGLSATVEVETKSIEVPFSEFCSFIASFRNRIFHNSLSSSNINLDELNGADLTCEPLIDPTFNWFTLVLCVVIKESIARHLP